MLEIIFSGPGGEDRYVASAICQTASGQTDIYDGRRRLSLDLAYPLVAECMTKAARLTLGADEIAALQRFWNQDRAPFPHRPELTLIPGGLEAEPRD